MEIEITQRSTRRILYKRIVRLIFFVLFIFDKVFTPNETYDQSIVIDLLYVQIVRDTFDSFCVRLTNVERTKLKCILRKSLDTIPIEYMNEWMASLDTYNVINIDHVHRIEQQSDKQTIIEQARLCSMYFSRLFPVFVRVFNRVLCLETWLDWCFQ
jgi:hypothetical protein